MTECEMKLKEVDSFIRNEAYKARLSRPYLEKEDVEQRLRIAAWKKYEELKDVKVLDDTTIKKYMCSAVKFKAMQIKSRQRKHIDELNFELHEEFVLDESDFFKSISQKLIVQSLYEQLHDKNNKTVFSLLYSGFSRKEIAKICHRSTRWVFWKIVSIQNEALSILDYMDADKVS